MTAPAPFTPPTWADRRLMQAYDLIEAIREEQHPEADIYGLLDVLLDKIEDADVELERMPK